MSDNTSFDDEQENFPGMIKNFTKSNLIDRIPQIRLAVMASQELPKSMKGHLVQLLLLWESYVSGELEELDKLLELVHKADFQSEAFRSALLWDLKGYGGSTPEDRRKTKDRAFKALAGAPPKDPRFADVLKETVSGHEIVVPDRFK
jgi:hypothetical protein